MPFITIGVLIIMGYLFGSIPFSYLIPKWIGKIDIRSHGSGNTGTTNVIRTLGLKVGVIAFIGDFLKGVVPTYIGMRLLPEYGGYIAAVFTVIGHCYPVWLKFKGGKGIATSAGTLLVLSPVTLAILLAVQFILLFLTRYMSLASLSSGVLYPILTFSFHKPPAECAFALFLGGFVFYRHRTNFMRLIRGEEKKLFGKDARK